MKYRKLPVTIDAWSVKELNAYAAKDWYGLPESVRDAYEEGGWIFGDLRDDGRRGIIIPTLEGPLFADPDDMVIRGVAGEFYPCKLDIFNATYEPVSA